MSSTGVFRCCDDLRRELVRGQTALNGIDYLEVVDHDEPDLDKRQRFLRIHFLNSPPPATPQPPLQLKQYVRIEGGERIKNIVVKDAYYDGEVLVVEVDRRGDFSPYTLRLVQPPSRTTPLAGLDVPLSTIEFSFKVECDSDFDCRETDSCPPESVDSPRIDYLARDYGSFRRMMLDRISLLVPGWRERTPADLGTTLVELLAYVADHLSYRQDAIATEAYLGTARKRTSVRRHARLVDYELRDGCNARAFVHLNVNAKFVLAAGTQFLTHVESVPTLITDPKKLQEALALGAQAFESMAEVPLDPDLNVLSFYTWGSENCCLPKGATNATFKDHKPIEEGAFLVLGEAQGPETGLLADADKTKRHVVKIRSVDHTFDALIPGTPITEVAWEEADALPFPLCISSTITQNNRRVELTDISIAIGNIVLADHGRTVKEDLGAVPEPALYRPPSEEGAFCSPRGLVAVTPRFTPRLTYGPLTHAAPLDDSSAQAALHWDLADVLPVVELVSPSTGPNQTDWEVRRDLLEAEAADTSFVADVEEDGLATIRFGDGGYGLRPSSGTSFGAAYRIGNGIAGNVGPSALTRMVILDGSVQAADVNFLSNPIGASGGVEPEALEHARRAAPVAYRTQERAVTEADYAEVTERHDAVDRAAATFLWTGSRRTVFVSVDRPEGLEVDDAFIAEIRDHVEKYRVIGKDVTAREPLHVSLEIVLTICVLPTHFRSVVESELRDVFTSFFDPDNFTFGQTVVLSRIVAAAMAVEGVDAVYVERFRRQGQPQTEAVASGVLTMNRLEVARLENSRTYPEHGSLTLNMRGGV